MSIENFILNDFEAIIVIKKANKSAGAQEGIPGAKTELQRRKKEVATLRANGVKE